MAQNYTRQSAFSDGDTITATLFNDEYNQLVNTFTYSSSDASATGHRHDGSTGEGGNIYRIGDLDFLNKIEADSTNNRWGFWVEVSSIAVEQLRIQDGAIVPVTDNDIDLGTSSLEFKNLYLDGTAKVDALVVDETATITGAATLSSTLTVEGATTLNGNTTIGNAATDTVTITADVSSNIIPSADSTYTLGDSSNYWSAGYIDALTTTGNVSIGGNLTVTGNATISGNLTFGDADTDTVSFSADVSSHILPDVDDTYDLGSSTKEWRNLYVDGTANIDSLVADTADINGGTIDGAIIGGASAAAGTFTTANATTVDTTNIEVTNLKAKDGTAAGSIADTTGVVTLASSVLTTTDINGGTIDGATIGGASAGAGTFTNLTASGTVSFSGATVSDGGTVTTVNIDGGSIDGTIIGAASTAAGSFTTLQADTSLNVDGTVTADGLTVSTATDALITIADATLPSIQKLELKHNAGTSTFTSGNNGVYGSVDFKAYDGTSTINRLGIATNGDISFYEDTGTTAQLVWDASADALTFGDSVKATFGAGSDLEIYHDGSNSYIKDNGTGGLILEGTTSTQIKGSSFVILRSLDGENMAVGNANGSFDLYYDNAKKLATTATGIDVTGDVSIGDGSASGTRLLMGAGGDSKMFHNGVDTYWINDTGNIVIRNESDDKDILLQTDDGSGGTTTYITVDGSETDVSLHYGGSVKLATTSTGIDVTGTVTADGLTVDKTSQSTIVATSDSTVDVRLVADTSLTEGSLRTSGTTPNLGFYVGGTKYANISDGGDISFYEDTGTTPKFFWDASAESLGIGTTTPNYLLDVEGSGPLFRINATSGDATAQFSVADTTSLNTINFGDSGSTTAGQITYRHNGDSMAFNVAGVEAVRILNGGNVGIGTSSPTNNLDIAAASSATLSVRNTSTVSSILLSNGSSANQVFSRGANSSTGRDLAFVQGTAEAMRIDSSGLVGIGTASPAKTLDVRTTTGNDAVIRVGSSGSIGINENVGTIEFYSADVDDAGVKASIANYVTGNQGPGGSVDGNLIFSTTDSDGGGNDSPTERMRIDSSGNLGLGVTPGAWNANNKSIIQLQNTANLFTRSTGLFATSNFVYNSADTGVFQANGYGIMYQQNQTAGTHVWLNTANNTSGAGATASLISAMTLDASGNLLVGKTSDNNAVAGTVISNSGIVKVTRTDWSLLLNRLTTDGDLALFQKDGTTVGSIGARNGTPYFANNVGEGIRIIDGYVSPCDSSGNGLNNAVDVGSATYKFKDLYLSGGVYLGGTGAANLLDDYEEGTFTPTVNGDATGVFGTAEGYYTKVGRLVFIELYFTVGTNFTSNTVGGLPFTVANLATGTSYGQSAVVLTSAADTVTGAAQESTTSVAFFNDHNILSTHAPNSTNSAYRLALCYQA